MSTIDKVGFARDPSSLVAEELLCLYLNRDMLVVQEFPLFFPGAIPTGSEFLACKPDAAVGHS